MQHPVFKIPVTIANGFDVVDHHGAQYIRVIAEGYLVMVVPTSPAELHRLARQFEDCACEAELLS